MKKILQICSQVILLICCNKTSFSQHYSFSNFSVEDGLAQSQVRSISQDYFGYLWFATEGGLSYFDGKEFRNFSQKDGLPSHSIFKVIFDKADNIWISTYNGLAKYDGKKFHTYTFYEDNLLNVANCFYVDKDDNLWFALEGGGISLYKNGDFKHYKQRDGFIDSRVSAISQDNDGNMWFATVSEGFFMFDGKIFHHIPHFPDLVMTLYHDSRGIMWFSNRGEIFSFNQNRITKHGAFPLSVYDIQEDNEGHIWFGTNYGALKYDGKEFLRVGEKEGLVGSSILDIFKDREGNMWFGTFGHGVFKSKGETFQVLHKPEELRDEVIMTINIDKEGNYWFGTLRKGLFKWDQKNLENYTCANSNVADFIYCSIKDKNGNLLFGSRGGGLVLYDNKGFKKFNHDTELASNSVFCMTKAKDGNVWIGTDKGVSIFDGEKVQQRFPGNKLNHQLVQSILSTSDGKVFIGTFRGINYIEKGNVFNLDHIKILKNARVYCMAEDQKGNLWMSVKNEGLVKYEIKTGKTTLFSESDGLSSNLIFNLIFDDEGNLFAGNTKGLDKIFFNEDQNILKIKHYGKNEGFAGIENTHNSVLKEEDGSIWFGTIKGAIKYNPDLDIENMIPPVTFIKGIKLFYEYPDWSAHADSITNWPNLPYNLKLPYDQNHLTFQFAGISFKNPEKVKFRYMLENLDKSWSPVTTNTEAVYANIPPGEYIFKVISSNSDGYWNETPVEFRFIILTPFWQTWWFYVLTAVIILLMIRFIYVSRLKSRLRKVLELESIKKRTLEDIRKKMAMDFHDEIGNQLASLKVYIDLINFQLKNRPQELDKLLSNMESCTNKLFQGTKDFIWSIDNKSDSLTELFTYLKDFGEDLFSKANVEFYANANVRFSHYGSIAEAEKFNCGLMEGGFVINLPSGWSRQIVLIFKEAMTNALKHSKCTSVTLNFVLSDNFLEISLTDNGSGIPLLFKSGKGLNNMNKRASLINCCLSVDDEEGKGTSVRLTGELPQYKLQA